MRSSQFISTVLGLSDANRAIRLRLLTAEGLIDDLLIVKYASGRESMWGGLEYSLQCVSTIAGMELKKFIANPAEIQFVTDSGTLRSVCGIISEAIEGQSDGGLATYQLIIRDVLSLLEQTCNTRIFRNRSEIEITEIILREWIQENPIISSAFRFEFKGIKKYPAREFIMQSNESTAAFLRRLWKRRGISWFILSQVSNGRGSNEVPCHILVLFDDSSILAENPAGAARYHRDSATEQRDSITSWYAIRRLTAGRSSRVTPDYKQGWPLSIQEVSLTDQGEVNMLGAAEAGDETVPVHSADAQLTSGKFKGIFRQSGYKHQSSYSDPNVMASTMYSLFKIISTMNWSKL